MSEYPETSGDTRVQVVTNGTKRLFSFDRINAVNFDAGQAFTWTTKDSVVLHTVACFTPQPINAEYFRVALDIQTPQMSTSQRIVDLFHDANSDPGFMWRSQELGIEFPPDTVFTFTWWSFTLATNEQFAWLNFEYLPRTYGVPQSSPQCPWILEALGGCR